MYTATLSISKQKNGSRARLLGQALGHDGVAIKKLCYIMSLGMSFLRQG
jgi:hypothetical protein